MILKLHSSEKRSIAALCDSDIIGKRFEQGKKVLDLDCEFYKGVEMSKKEVLKSLQDADIINAVGKESVKLCVEAGLVDQENLITVDGVPHAQAILKE